jgi:adenylosuccinate lyase
MLKAISPIDGRYASKTEELADYFSEFALIKYRVFVEIQYFIALTQWPLPKLESFEETNIDALNQVFEEFSMEDAQHIKSIERTTNHDVKAVEYFLKEKFEALGIAQYKEFIHLALTSQDINNTATPLLLKNAIEEVYLPELDKVMDTLADKVQDWAGISMLAKTHGQPASPTRLGKEFKVFLERIQIQVKQIKEASHTAKFGGATGNFNAHQVTYPDIEWKRFADEFTMEYLGLNRQQTTTQIEHYDGMASLFHNIMRINTILVDLCRDIWTYVSMEYFKQRVIAGEVGSSAMPHKVNPIDFENAEGNLGVANAIFAHLASKLPISRLQRDLTDSTVLRNVGVPFAHTLIAFKSIVKGFSKLKVNEAKIIEDLDANWMVVAEAIQNILRREGYPNPYETLKALTRGNDEINQEVMHRFIHDLDVSDEIKEELKRINPQNYIGII